MTDMEAARDKWWSDIARRGDPERRPNLTWEAFEAGYRAASPPPPTLPDLEGVKEEDFLAAIIAYETARVADGSLGDNLPAMRRALTAALQALEAKNV